MRVGVSTYKLRERGVERRVTNQLIRKRKSMRVCAFQIIGLQVNEVMFLIEMTIKWHLLV